MTIATRPCHAQEVEDSSITKRVLDEWKLEEWQALLADDATYYVPPTTARGEIPQHPFLVADTAAHSPAGDRSAIRTAMPSSEVAHPR